jgi:hypothetical protein
MTKMVHPANRMARIVDEPAPLSRSTRRQPADDTSARIRVAAAAEFGAKGYEGASIQRIEYGSGGSRPALSCRQRGSAGADSDAFLAPSS